MTFASKFMSLLKKPSEEADAELIKQVKQHRIYLAKKERRRARKQLVTGDLEGEQRLKRAERDLRHAKREAR